MSDDVLVDREVGVDAKSRKLPPSTKVATAAVVWCLLITFGWIIRPSVERQDVGPDTSGAVTTIEAHCNPPFDSVRVDPSRPLPPLPEGAVFGREPCSLHHDEAIWVLTFNIVLVISLIATAVVLRRHENSPSEHGERFTKSASNS